MRGPHEPASSSQWAPLTPGGSSVAGGACKLQPYGVTASTANAKNTSTCDPTDPRMGPPKERSNDKRHTRLRTHMFCNGCQRRASQTHPQDERLNNFVSRRPLDREQATARRSALQRANISCSAHVVAARHACDERAPRGPARSARSSLQPGCDEMVFARSGSCLPGFVREVTDTGAAALCYPAGHEREGDWVGPWSGMRLQRADADADAWLRQCEVRGARAPALRHRGGAR